MSKLDSLCIGSLLWDIIGRTDLDMPLGSDKPGRIAQIPGGVAMNVAMTLARLGHRPAVLSVLGCDAAGDQLIEAAQALGIETAHVLRTPDWPTDRYMAIESPSGLVAAIADAHSLEAAGSAILAPLIDGPLGDAVNSWRGMIALDGNLTEAVLHEIATQPALQAADLRVAPASPGKARRLLALRPHASATYYVNREEAGLILERAFDDAAQAAEALCAQGLARAIVTDGARAAADASAVCTLVLEPPQVPQRRVTGAGDTFMAAHISAEMHGNSPEASLATALGVAARYVAGENAPANSPHRSPQ